MFYIALLPNVFSFFITLYVLLYLMLYIVSGWLHSPGINLIERTHILELLGELPTNPSILHWRPNMVLL